MASFRRSSLAIVVVALSAGCPDRVPVPVPDPAPRGEFADPGNTMTGREGPRDPIPAIVLVGETLGWLEPCGCTEGMLGGLPRRVGYLRALEARGYEPVVLDLGDLVREPGRQAELKLDALAKLYKRLPVRAVAVGERDLVYLDRLAAAGLPLLFAEPGARTTVKTRAGSLSVAAAVGPSLRASFEAAGGRAAGAIAATPTADIVLFHGRLDEARALYADRRDVAVVFAGHEDELPPAPVRLAGGALLVGTGDKGKYAALIALGPPAAPGGPPRAEALPRLTALGDRIADDPAAAKLVDEYKDLLFAENLVEASERNKLPETGGTFVGAEACSACHEAEYAVFEKTKHFHAYESLAPRKGTRDPECLRCHSTGFGFESGFAGEEKTPDLARVSCESCHGVGTNHIRNPAETFGKIKDPPKLCVECHDKENSPNFDYSKYWPRIQHKRAKK